MWFRQNTDQKLKTTTKGFTWHSYGANFDNYIIFSYIV